MPMRPRAGTTLPIRHKKSCANSSALGALNECTSQPCGSMPDITCLTTPSLPAASMPCSTINTPHRPWAESRRCNSSIRAMPSARIRLTSSMSVGRPKRSAGSWSASLKCRGLSIRQCLTILANFMGARLRSLAISSRIFPLQISDHRRRHARIDVGRPADDADIGKLGVLVGGDVAHDPGAQLVGILACGEPFHQAKKAPIAHHGPSRFGIELRDGNAGLLQKFAAQIVTEVEHAVLADVRRLRRAARKIGTPRPRRIGRHRAEEVAAVGRAQYRGGKEIIDVGIWKFPVAPSDEARIVGLEAGAAQRAPGNDVAIQEQYAAVPYSRPPAF